MAKVISDCSGTPANDSERKAIAFLRDRLPDSWLIIHNFELRQRVEVFEIDLAIIAPHGVFLVDIKGTRGLIDVYGSKWYPAGRQSFHSPMAKLRNHAKILATIIRESNKGLAELRKAHIQAVVLLTADDAKINDGAGIDSPDVTQLKNCLKYFSDKNRIPSHRLNNIKRFHKIIVKAICGKSKPKSSATVYGNWQIEEKLGGDDHYIEYRAKHCTLGKSAGYTRLRVYQIDPYQNEEIRKSDRKLISNSFKAVSHMTAHPNILTVREYCEIEDTNQIALVTDDIKGQALRQHIAKQSLALTFDQKFSIMQDVLSALDHAHKHEVIHRNLSPDSIIVAKGGDTRITSFDFARVGKDRSTSETIAGQKVEDLATDYWAPELFNIDQKAIPQEASIASDLYSAGLIFYELIVGKLPFKDVDEMMEADGKFLEKPSVIKQDLPVGLDEWLQKFCEFDQEDRFSSAAIAKKDLKNIILNNAKSIDSDSDIAQAFIPEDFTNLPRDFILDDRYQILEKLGSGGFAVVYKVFDALGDINRVIKIVTKDRKSVYERLKREYAILIQTENSSHPYVVKVIWADRFNDKDRTPYIVFEYVQGMDVNILVDAQSLSIEESVTIVMQAADGLSHLHELGIYHQDIKPSNLLLTDDGVKIIDFNVAVSENDDVKGGGGTRRYLPPDYEIAIDLAAEDRIDRDLYALGITFYECLTGGSYPFNSPKPPAKKAPKDIRAHQNCSSVNSGLKKIINRMLAPQHKRRYISASELLADFKELNGKYRSIISSGDLIPTIKPNDTPSFKSNKANFNPFVSHLLTIYSQSQVSNSGTRGLDQIGKATYVPTYLDKKLQPAILKGQFRLVIISGNAGDGKTAFIQQLETFAETKGATIKHGANGAVFQIKGHTFQSNYDGSQDEGDETNSNVLIKFFAPFKGISQKTWKKNQTRIIAINEGRLVDFFLEYEKEFPLLSQIVNQGLVGKSEQDELAIINLSLRSVIAEEKNGRDSIFERLIYSITNKKYWVPCETCDIKKRCYAYHNLCTFQNTTAGPKVIERLKTLYTIIHLRGQLHITMRELRSAIAFMLVGIRDCDGIHQLLNGGVKNRDAMLDGYYFNSWMGGNKDSSNRLVTFLHEIDIAQVSNSLLDRELGFVSPTHKNIKRHPFENRTNYDDELLEMLFNQLPRDFSKKNRRFLLRKHQDYMGVVRRRHFFENREDTVWKKMLPYKSYERFSQVINNVAIDPEHLDQILMAINRGEGLRDPARLGKKLVLRVRKIDKGTIASYRVFPGANFSLGSERELHDYPFLETCPQSITLRYDTGDGHSANLPINLDIFEMLMKFNDGYRPSVEEEEGYYLSLSIFKNVLSAAPYQEVILTESGHDFFQIRRDEQGILHLSKMQEGA